jgi:hypothetical protein
VAPALCAGARAGCLLVVLKFWIDFNGVANDAER